MCIYREKYYPLVYAQIFQVLIFSSYFAIKSFMHYVKAATFSDNPLQKQYTMYDYEYKLCSPRKIFSGFQPPGHEDTLLEFENANDTFRKKMLYPSSGSKIQPCENLANLSVWRDLTNTKRNSLSWKAKRSSASQEILRILWKPKVHHLIHNSPQIVPIVTTWI